MRKWHICDKCASHHDRVWPISCSFHPLIWRNWLGLPSSCDYWSLCCILLIVELFWQRKRAFSLSVSTRKKRHFVTFEQDSRHFLCLRMTLLQQDTNRYQIDLQSCQGHTEGNIDGDVGLIVTLCGWLVGGAVLCRGGTQKFWTKFSLARFHAHLSIYSLSYSIEYIMLAGSDVHIYLWLFDRGWFQM